MKIGVIVVFHNNEKDIDSGLFIEHLSEAKNLELCLVNNASRDKTYELLKEIKEMCFKNVSLVDIKKFKSDDSAVRSGARFMFNQFDLKHVGFVNTNQINDKIDTVSNLIKMVSENQDVILKYNCDVIKLKGIKQTLFQSVFSIVEYLEKLEIDSRLLNYT